MEGRKKRRKAGERGRKKLEIREGKKKKDEKEGGMKKGRAPSRGGGGGRRLALYTESNLAPHISPDFKQGGLMNI